MDDCKQGWVPPELSSTKDWMERYFRIPAEDSDNAGLYCADFVPYFWGVMHAMDLDEVEMIVLMKAAQIGWTLLETGWLAKRICTQPTRILGLFPKDEKARDFMEEKFEPAVRSTPELGRLIDVSQSRKSGNRITKKKFPGGSIKVFGSNSVSNVKSTPAAVVIVEEPDDTNKSVGDQGGAISLARERTKQFNPSKFIIGGTPSVEGPSEMGHYIKLSNQRVLPITCHDCGDKHVLEWENVSWHEREDGPVHPIFKRSEPSTAVYVCPCGSPWDDWQRKENIINTCIAARDSGDPFCGWTATVDGSSAIEGFKDISELYLCMPKSGIESLVRDYLEAEYKAENGDESDRIVFRNSKLGKTYEFTSKDALSSEEIRELADDYEELICPSGVIRVTAGIDIQDDRIAIIIRGWGRDQESWLLYWGEIYGNTVDIKDPVWGELAGILFSGFEHPRFGMVYTDAVSIDSSDGGTNQAVYSWVRAQGRKRNCLIMAIKGSSNDSGKAEIFAMPRKLDHVNPKRTTKADKYQVKVYIVGTSKAKDVIAKRLCGTSAFMHSYENARSDYWEQVTAEIKAPSKRLRGSKVWQKKSGRRNEGLDCEVYALHAAIAIKVHAYTESKWDALEKKMAQKSISVDDLDEEELDAEREIKNKKPLIRPRRKSGFISGSRG